MRTDRFDECVAFYRDVFGLPVWFTKKHLACLRLGNGYLMIETGGLARDGRKPSFESPCMLRFNVDDVPASAALMGERGVRVDVRTFSWRTVGTFCNADGKACELKNADDPFSR